MDYRRAVTEKRGGVMDTKPKEKDATRGLWRVIMLHQTGDSWIASARWMFHEEVRREPEPYLETPHYWHTVMADTRDAALAALARKASADPDWPGGVDGVLRLERGGRRT